MSLSLISKISTGRTSFELHRIDYPSFGGCISNYNSLVIQNSLLSGCESFAGGGLINHAHANACNQHHHEQQ